MRFLSPTADTSSDYYMYPQPGPFTRYSPLEAGPVVVPAAVALFVGAVVPFALLGP